MSYNNSLQDKRYFLDVFWPTNKPDLLQCPEEYEDNYKGQCCQCVIELAVIPASIYHEASLFNLSKESLNERVESGEVNNCSSKILFALKGFFSPVRTQRERDRQANEEFGELRLAKGWKEKTVKTITTAALQTAALLNYTWTVLTCPITIPIHVISAIVLGALSAIVGCTSCSEGTKKKFKYLGCMSAFTLFAHLHGVPRATVGIVQKVATILFIPFYLTGKAIYDCKMSEKNHVDLN